MFRLWLTNMHWWHHEQYSNLTNAIAAARKLSFETDIYEDDVLVASCSTIGGLKLYQKEFKQ